MIFNFLKKVIIVSTTICFCITAVGQGRIIREGHNNNIKTTNSKVNNQASNRPLTGFNNGVEWVDLGLPSGLKWATCNIGASNPYQYGDYYAWGDIEVRDEMYAEIYFDFDHRVDSNWSYYFKYYGTSSKHNKITPNSGRDVAHEKLGSSWRLPTSNEILELANQCRWSLKTLNGIKGYRVTGPNGKYIFLPLAGKKDAYGGTQATGQGEFAYYITSELYEIQDVGDLQYCIILHFSNLSKPVNMYFAFRMDRCTVRPVCN